MKKIITLSCIFLIFVLLIPAGSVSAASNVPYATYTYSNDGNPQLSPHAYIPAQNFSEIPGLDTPLSGPSDIAAGADDRLYIADTGNDRIIILDADGTLLAVIGTFTLDGREDSLSSPQGVFVTDDGTLYVSDTGHQRIVCFSSAYEPSYIIHAPQSPLFGEGFEFRPKSLAVDKTGRIFVVAENVNMGIMVLDRDGGFKNYFGSQKVKYSPIELFWRTFMTEEQISRTESFVPTEYNSISMDSEGFLFVTSAAIDPLLQYSATVNRDTSDQYAPVKRFGAAGTDILVRSGAFPPSGDVSVSVGNLEKGPSSIVDCVPGLYGTYTLLDAARNKLFTYDSEGNLLYAFGGSGSQAGLFEGLCAASVLSDNRIVCIDSITSEVTFFSQTEYSALLFDVMRLHDERRYSEEADVWKQVLLRNNNIDIAYIGLGNALFKDGEYTEAMSLFRIASDKANYSLAFKEVRTRALSDWILLIPVAVIGLIAGLIFLFSAAARCNAVPVQTAIGRRTLPEHLLYSLHLITHPFDGFWDLNHEGRGSLPAGLLILGASGAVMTLEAGAGGYLFQGSSVLIWAGPLVLFAGIALFVLSNWFLTSLTEGKGTARQILTASCYATSPILLLGIPRLILSYFLVLEEASYLSALTVLSYLWVGVLLFVAILVVHQYSLPKALLTVLFTVVAMVVIIVLSLMFFNLLEPMVSFFINYYRELSYRF
ncbi:MAG: YIP1 family protein [Oscillospiraceae bacterium]|nr:YIP1 family protein [Oscillospiraceae bacterium]